ncbi:MAG: hypothetical protein ABIO70_10005 [Pseudomonadota bacterium]
MMVGVAEDLVRNIYLLAEEDRTPVIQSIVKSAGDGVERRFLESRRMLVELGVSRREALTQAFELAIHGPDGENILKVVASAAAREKAQEGLIPSSQIAAVAHQYEGSLVQAEQGVSGLGFIATAVKAVASIGTAAVKGIAKGVHKKRSRRRHLKVRMTPLSAQESLTIAQATAPQFPTFESAQPAILGMIAEIRYGRSGWLLDPASGAEKGSKVNEYRDVRRVWLQVRAQLDAAIRAEQSKKKNLAVMGAGIGGAILVVFLAIALKKKRQQ